ncbi:unnamed protein product [Amoebophrya sp. A25]|nr:unnamed protein product [Amoebophrya sp. A25]|eukprot:GSA25T00018545001.1
MDGFVKHRLATTEFELLEEDLNTYEVPGDARVVFIAATMFKAPLLANIRRNLSKYVDPKTCLIITLQLKLDNVKIIEEVPIACSWGITKAIICTLDDGER